MRHYIEAWCRWKDFSGKTSRAAFWSAIVAHEILVFLFLISLSIISASWFEIDADALEQLIHISTQIIGIAFLLPLISMTVRRLNDAGYSARSFFWLLIPVIGMIAFFARLCTKSNDQ